MIYNIRRGQNVIVDIEVLTKKNENSENNYIEIHTTIPINNYSNLLLDVVKSNYSDVEGFIRDFNDLDTLRTWLWESYFIGNQNVANEETKEEVHSHIELLLELVVQKYKDFGLSIVTD